MASSNILADRVKETTITVGTGTINLGGASAQFQSFIVAVGTGNTCDYTILSGNGIDWECGNGTVTAGSPNTLSRATIYSSSNSGSAISLSGTSMVFLDRPAIRFLQPLMVTQTSAYFVLASDSNTHFDNLGASGSVTFSLPAAARGLRYEFTVMAAQTLEILAAGSDIISIGANASAGGGNVAANALYSHLAIEAKGTVHWIVTSAVGSWTLT
jgi:hypothetical protein